MSLFQRKVTTERCSVKELRDHELFKPNKVTMSRHPIALWRRRADLIVALAMLLVARACHVEAYDLKNNLCEDSRKL